MWGATMSKDLFAPKTNGHSYLAPIDDPFRFLISVFGQDGATRAIIKANKLDLSTYYPTRTNIKGDVVPLWRNYLMIEFWEFVTIDLCRNTPHFIKLISARDPDSDLSHPVMVRRNAVKQNMAMVLAGEFDAIAPRRRFHGKGSLIRVTGGALQERRVRLEADILPEMPGHHAVAVSIGLWRGTIEIFKLAL
jgi:hypothetical protein